MIVYVENPKESTEKLLKLLNSARSQNTRLTHKSQWLIYANSEHAEIKIISTIPFLRFYFFNFFNLNSIN